jgi:hypothetical protein
MELLVVHVFDFLIFWVPVLFCFFPYFPSVGASRGSDTTPFPTHLTVPAEPAQRYSQYDGRGRFPFGHFPLRR